MIETWRRIQKQIVGECGWFVAIMIIGGESRTWAKGSELPTKVMAASPIFIAVNI